MDFQPEIKVLPWKDKYLPMYRLRPTDRWSVIPRDGKKVECETSSQARKIAQELVDAIVSPTHVIEDGPEPIWDVEDWRERKDAALLAEKHRVFGTAPLRVIRDCKGNHVEVVRKGRARA